MKKCWHCPLFNKLSLVTRIMTGSMLVLGLALVLLFMVLMQREAQLLESVLRTQLHEELGALTVSVTDDLVIGDYATLEHALKTHSKNQHVARIFLNPQAGKSIVVAAPIIPAQAPNWFVKIMNVPPIEGTQNISLGGKNYGEVNVLMTPVALIINAWEQLSFMLKLVLAALFLNGLVIYLILRSSLRPLKALIVAEHEFAGGDHAIRFAESGSPEVRELIVEFNTLAQQVEQQTVALKSSEQVWSFALEGSGNGVWDWDLQTNRVELTQAGKAMFGFQPDEIGSDMKLWIARVHPDDLPKWIETWRNFIGNHDEKIACEYRVRCKDNHWIWIGTRGMVVQRNADGRVVRMIGTHSDITPRKQMEEQIRQLAFYDTLTALPNRRLLNDRLVQAMSASKRSDCYGAVLFLDLDNFKPINDTHGHGVGDLLLLEAATRLKNCVRETDTVARFGGDEFVVMLGELETNKNASIAQARQVAEKVLVALSSPYLLTVSHDGQPYVTVEHHCTASIGVALFINHTASQEEILNRADEAMYQAKAAGRNSIRLYAEKA